MACVMLHSHFLVRLDLDFASFRSTQAASLSSIPRHSPRPPKMSDSSVFFVLALYPSLD